MPRINWSMWGAGAAVLAIIHHATVWRLVGSEWSRTDFDYCYLIPPVMAYLIWERRAELQGLPSRAAWGGLAAFAGAVFFLLLGELGGEFLSLNLSLWFAVLGVSWSILGWRKLQVVIFPIVLLLTAFPPPNYVYSRLTMGMQLLSTRLGVEFLHALNVPAFREGNVIDLGFTQLEVVAACSGLRFLIPLIVVGMLLTYYFRQKWWKRTLLLLCTLPLAVIMNGLRIGISGLLARILGAQVLEGSAHDIMGWIMFVLSTLILLGCMRIMTPKGQPLLASFPGPQADATPESPARLPLAAGLLLLLLAAGFVRYRALVPDVSPQAAPLASFPASLPGWEGRRIAMEQHFVDALDFTDYVQIDYNDAQGRTVDFYVAWYASQSKGESIHSPETCLRGGGWHFERTGAKDVQIPGYRTLRVNRSILEQDGHRLMAYFWFPARGRDLTNGVELKLYTMWDSLTTRRTDGALVRLITQLGPNESDADGETRLQAFLGQALPLLERMLPGRDLPPSTGARPGS
jgi:exosortase D (VPLPA-CTERM-specific)